LVEEGAQPVGGPVGGPVAAVDCGTNTIKLLIGELPEVAVREMRMVRLGQDLDRTGRLSDEALGRAFAAIEEYAALIAAHGVPPSRIRFCATSATRDAANADVFTAGVRERLGVEPDVVDGAEEAALTFDGAVRHLRTPPASPVLVVDIGGGSTELVLGSATDGPGAGHSMDIGSVRLHERHLHSDPPTAAEVAACVEDIDAHLDACPVEVAAAATVVGVAGTVTTLTAGVLGLPGYDRDAIDQAVLATDDVHALAERLVAMTVAQRLELPWMHPGRADVIDAGALIWSRVLRRAAVTRVITSEADILDGIAWSIGHS
jgi:exopolyphosphatase/guanosine-5'-triphosphate,3'-diphosphate pyrophosphatase